MTLHMDAATLTQRLAGARLRADAIPGNPFANVADRMVAAGTIRMDGMPMSRQDALHFQRELEHLSATVHMTEFQELTAEQAFPMAPDMPPPGAESYAWPELEILATGGAGKGYGSLGGAGEVTRAKVSTPLRVYTSHYGYDIGDQQRAALHNMPLSTYKAIAAKRIIAQDVNSDVWNGNANMNIPGLLSNASIPIARTVVGSGGTRPWATKTADEIEKDLVDSLMTHIASLKAVKGLYPNRLAVPSSRYARLAATKRATGTDTTLLQYLELILKAATGDSSFQITSHPEMEVGSSAMSALPFFMFYRHDPMVAGRVQALPFSELAAQLLGFQTVVPCHAQGGGLVVFKPLAIRFGWDI